MNIRPNEENSIRRKSDHIIKRLVLDINDLQNVTSRSAKERSVLDNEKLLFLGGPEHPPRGGEGVISGDGVAANGGQRIDCVDDLGEFLGV